MARYNMSKREAKRSGKKRKKISGSSKKSSSSSEKKAKKEAEKYYEEESISAKKTAKTYTDRLTADLDKIYADAGIAKTRATEDYNTNIGNITNEKNTGLDDLDYYVSTSTERTGEDLQTALASETRRFEIEGDKINRSLAAAGLTFSERKSEKTAEETSRLQSEAINVEANRSFADIERYQFAKNRDIEDKFSREIGEAGTTKKRTIENINDTVSSTKTAIGRQKEDISTGLADTLRQLERGEKVDVGQIGLLYDQLNLSKELRAEERSVGVGASA